MYYVVRLYHPVYPTWYLTNATTHFTSGESSAVPYDCTTNVRLYDRVYYVPYYTLPARTCWNVTQVELVYLLFRPPLSVSFFALYGAFFLERVKSRIPYKLKSTVMYWYFLYADIMVGVS